MPLRGTTKESKDKKGGYQKVIVFYAVKVY